MRLQSSTFTGLPVSSVGGCSRTHYCCIMVTDILLSPSILLSERAILLRIVANIPVRSPAAADLPSSPRQFTRQAQLVFSLSAIEPGVEGHCNLRPMVYVYACVV